MNCPRAKAMLMGLTLTTVAFVTPSSPLLAQSASAETGRLSGRVVNSETGLPIANAVVTLEGTELTATTNLDGYYTLSGVPTGTKNVVVRHRNFQESRVTDLTIAANGEVTQADLPLRPGAEEIVRLEAFTVSAAVLQNSGIGLLSSRQKSTSVSDSIGSSQMSKLGFGTAAAALKAVTGASVVGGKYVHIRGLGERYSNTLINGVEAPSADPDKRSVNMDMFPTDLIDAIVASKTFTPDKPGNFTGGAVDMKTKEFPDQFTGQVATSLSYNSQVTGEDFLTYEADSNIWGKDRGSRDLPSELLGQRLPLRFTAPGVDAEIGRLTRQFSSTLAPYSKSGPLSHGFSAAIGGLYEMKGGGRFGYSSSLSYDRTFNSYREGVFARYERQGVNDPALGALVQLKDARSEDEALLGGLFNIAYQFSPDHQIALNSMVNRSGTDMARRQTGLNVAGGGISETSLFTTRALRYTERGLRSIQLAGKHLIPSWRETRIEWSATDATTSQDEPDTRFFSSFQTDDGNQFFEASGLPRPARFFRDLEESRRDYLVDITIPFSLRDGLESRFKFGGAYADTEREFRERLFEYSSTVLRYDGNDQTFLRESQVGQVDPNTGRFLPGQIYLVESTSFGNSYDGAQKVAAGYAMADVALTQRLRIIGGIRREDTDLQVVSQDPQRKVGTLNNEDYLPSINLVYALSPKVNLRAAFTKTIARPNFREIADYASFEFVGDFVYIGNPDLRRTTINNYDLRWEWFPKPGEIVAVSVFAKEMKDPIERGVFSVVNSGELQYQNAPDGQVAGIEFEARKGFGFLSSSLENLSGGVNFTWVDSQVKISDAELAFLRFYDPGAGDTRQLAGQSPYIANVDLSYAYGPWGTNVSVYYNIFGERLAIVSPPGTPNVFEQPSPSLDFILSQRLGNHLKLTLSAKNLLNSAYEETYEYKGISYQRAYYTRGRTFSVGLTYSY